jgi:hypothetical protein
VTDLQSMVQLMTDHILAALLLVAIIGGISILAYAQFRKDSFDLRALVVDPKTKEPSVHQLGQITALIISSWGFIVLVLHGQLTEVYFTTYMVAWAGANALNAFISRKDSGDLGNSRDEHRDVQ